MDFFYAEDLCMVIETCIKGNKHDWHTPVTDLNIVYDEKMTLLEIAQYINGLSDYKVEIKILNDKFDKHYTGDGKTLACYRIPFVGLKRGIKNVYDSLMGGNNG